MHMPCTLLITAPPKQNETNTAHKAPTRIEVEARIAIHYGEIGGRIILNQPEALSHYLVGYNGGYNNKYGVVRDSTASFETLRTVTH